MVLEVMISKLSSFCICHTRSSKRLLENLASVPKVYMFTSKYVIMLWLFLGGQAPVVVTEAAASVFAQHVVPVTPPSRPNCESWTQAQVEEWINKELDR